MKKTTLTLSLLLLFSPLNHAQTSGGINLEAVMKQMRFEYKQALKAQSNKVFSAHLANFKLQLAQAQQFPFSDMRRAKAREGLAKVAQLIDAIPTDNAANLQRSKDMLAELEQLKEQYHDKKPMTFWQKMFGE